MGGRILLRKFINAILVALIATTVLYFAISFVARDFSAQQTKMVWLSVIGFAMLGVMLTKMAMHRK